MRGFVEASRPRRPTLPSVVRRLRHTVRGTPELVRAFDRELGPGWVQDPVPGLERSSRVTLVARGRNRSLYRVDKILPDGGSVYVKHQRYPYPGRLFTWVFGPWGRRELEALRTVRGLGVPAVEPLLGGVVERGPLVHQSWLATRALPGAQNLSEWERDARRREPRPGPLRRDDLAPDEVRRALPDLWRRVAALHRERFYGRTLAAKNVLAHRGPDRRLAFTLHDLPRPVHRPGRPLSLRRAVYDLACLERWALRWLGPDERRALRAAYCEALAEGPPPEIWERRVARRVERLLNRTWGSWLLHRVRRTLKDLPRVGHWFR